MKATKWVIVAVAVGLTAGGLFLNNTRAQAFGGERFQPGRFLERAKQKLGITQDQASKIKHELSLERSNIVKLLTSLHESRIQLRQTIQKAGVTESEVRAASATVAAAEAEVAVERAKLYQHVSPILTPAQLEKIGDFEQRVDDFLDTVILTIDKRLAE